MNQKDVPTEHAASRNCFIRLKNKSTEAVIAIMGREDEELQRTVIPQNDEKELVITNELLSSNPPSVIYFLKEFWSHSATIDINENTVNTTYEIKDTGENTVGIEKKTNQTL
jgi:hypothetical protein